MKDIFDLIGRIFISFIFFYQAYIYFVNRVASDYLSLGEISLLILGSILILIGYRSKLGAILLLALLLPRMTRYFLQFNDSYNQEIFMYNLGLVGGLFVILAHGSGKYSVKRILARAKK